MTSRNEGNSCFGAMASPIKSLNDLFGISNLSQLRLAVLGSDSCLTLPQVQKLALHAASLATAPQEFRLAIVHTYTSELLDPWLNLAATLHDLKIHIHHAPYGLSLQEADAGSKLVRHEPDVTLLMLRREDLHPGLAKPLAGLGAARRSELSEQALEFVNKLLSEFRKQLRGHIVLTLLPSLHPPELGMFDTQCEHSEKVWWAEFKCDLARQLRVSVPDSLFLDLDEIVEEIGRKNFFDRRFWYSARYPFTSEGAAEIARGVASIGVLIKLPKAKVIVLDADDTLWGGTIGEDGIDGIALGPEYPGNAFVDFQRRLLDYRQRGFLLVLCSKNNPADIEQVLKEHPHQLLRDEHFATKRVNWLPKAENLVSLAEEVNLALDSFVMVDDSAHECAAIRALLPQIEVVQVPSKPAEIPSALDKIARLQILSLTAEDLRKTELYSQERQRRELQQTSRCNGISLEDYLESLNMRMRICFDELAHSSRLAQLEQKTNQFNLTTRRYTEQQLQAFMEDPSYLVADFSLTDIFGDSGIVGLAVVRWILPHRAEIDSFLMSCRVIGRVAESAFLHAILRQLQQEGITEVKASYLQTPKNSPAKSFLISEQFEECAPGDYRRNLQQSPPLPESRFPIKIELKNQFPVAQFQ